MRIYPVVLSGILAVFSPTSATAAFDFFNRAELGPDWSPFFYDEPMLVIERNKLVVSPTERWGAVWFNKASRSRGASVTFELTGASCAYMWLTLGDWGDYGGTAAGVVTSNGGFTHLAVGGPLGWGAMRPLDGLPASQKARLTARLGPVSSQSLTMELDVDMDGVPDVTWVTPLPNPVPGSGIGLFLEGSNCSLDNLVTTRH